MSRDRSRRRSRGRGRGRTGLGSTALVVALVVFVASGVPGLAVTQGAVDRNSAVDVVDDLDGAQKLNVASELQEGSESCLVEITNNLGQDVTVTVTLAENSKVYGNLNVSLADSVLSGDSVEFDLAVGDTQTVKMEANSGTAGNTTYFHVSSTGTGIYAETRDRSAPIKSSASTSCA